MKKIFFTLLLLCAITSAYSSTSFDFYKSIPKYESIKLSGQEISITIYSNYTVSLSASKKPDSKTTSSLSGSGIVLWNAENECLVLEVKGSLSGNYKDSEEIYTTEKKYNVGSTLANGLFGSGTADYYRYEKVYDHTEYYYASGSENFALKIPMVVADREYKIPSQTFNVTLTGDVTRKISYSINDEVHQLIYGNVKENTNNTANDEFGAWQWTKDKSEIYLYSVNMPSDKLLLKKDSSNVEFKLIFSFNGEQIEGASSSETNIGKLLQLNFSFEDGANVKLPFYEAGGFQYTYATYNRFLEEWNWSATSIIDQIKDKQTLILSYKKNGVSHTAIFELEGLAAILSYL